jgi:general secretion pathway protein K
VSGRERGVAAITAILIVAVAASAATLMLAQQSAMVDQATLISSRAQADQYARAGLDWARGVLMESRKASPSMDALNQGWAQPIAGLPVDRAVVAGVIIDEQGKFNLNNLVVGSAASGPDVQAFRQLLGSLGLAQELADAVVDWLDADSDLFGPGGAEDAYYLSLPKPYRTANAPMMQVEELYQVRGFDAATVKKLRPFVTALPTSQGATRINMNTAPAEVLLAYLPRREAQVKQLVRDRAARPLRDENAIKTWGANTLTADELSHLGVASNFFYVRVQVAQDDVELSADALVARATNASVNTLWLRPRY